MSVLAISSDRDGRLCTASITINSAQTSNPAEIEQQVRTLLDADRNKGLIRGGDTITIHNLCGCQTTEEQIRNYLTKHNIGHRVLPAPEEAQG